MNANTRLRLWKETRALLPMWAAAMVLMIGSGLIGAAFENHTALACHIITGIGGCWLLGAVSVGHEFDHRTMGLLLCQPVPRSRLWAEKMLVLSIAVGTLWWSVSIVSWLGLGYGMPSGEAVFSSAGILAIAICAAPVLTLLARSTIGGVALTLVGPFVLLLVTGVAVSALVTIYGVENLIGLTHSKVVVIGLTHAKVVVTDHTPIFAALLILYCGGLAWFGWRKFVQWEDVNLLAQEFAAPRQFDSLFARLTAVLAPGRDSQLANLLRKEVRLQRPAVFVAVFLVALWLAFIVARRVHPALGAEVLIVPSILLGLGIPVIAGIVAVAEERSLGVHEWHLTLPVSARRQWGVKVLVALGVNVAFGILLPGLLAHASSWLANNPQLVAEIPGRNVSPLLIANAVIFCAALYASSASANSIRALVGTIVLFVAGGLVLNFSDYVVSSIGTLQFVAADRVTLQDPPYRLSWVYLHRWLLGWSCFTAWLFFLGLANYRHALESLWQPTRRVGVLIGWICAFVFAAIVW